MNRFLQLTFAGFVILISCQPTTTTSVDYFPIEGNAWHIEITEDKQGQVQSLIYAAYDGTIAGYDPIKKSELWEYESGSFIFDLETADINKDGNIEVMAVNAAGQLIVLDHRGKKLWSFSDSKPLFNVVAGDISKTTDGLEIVTGGISRIVFVLDAEGNMQFQKPGMDRLVFRLEVFDQDADGIDEILVIENRTVAQMLKAENNQLSTVWRKVLTVPEEYINWENPRGQFYPFSLISTDINRDGTPEIIGGDTYFNKQAVGVFTAAGEPIWISEKQPPFENRPDTQTEFYSTAFVRTGDILQEVEGDEIVSVSGGNFRIYSKEGKLLGEQGTRIGFTDFEITGNNIYLSSAPNGDNTLYRITLDNNWEKSVSSIERRGKYKEVTNNLEKLSHQVRQYKGLPDNDITYEIAVGWAGLNEKNIDNLHRQTNWFKSKFPYDNLKNIYRLKVIEPTPPLDENGEPWSEWRWSVDAINGTMTVEEILEKARWIEENEIPTLFYMGHSCMPFITLETAEKILQTAPEYCVGFITSEDEQIERIPRYFKHYFGPLADLCVKYGYKVAITKNKGLWWLSSPANRDVYEGLFAGERKKVVMAATEDSNSRTPEINLLARGGLWQANLLNHNEVSIHADLFSFDRYFQWEYPKSGSPYLRLMVAHTTLGMTQINTRINDIYNTDSGYVFNPIGKESSVVFFHMLGKGIVRSSSPEDILGYNPIGFVVHQPSDKWLVDAHNGHAPEKWVDDEELHNAVIPHNGSLWGMTNTPEHALQYVLLDKRRQFGYQIPATPYGLIAFVPEHTDLSKVKGIRDWWHTDGIYAWKDGAPKLTGAEAAEAIRTDFEKSAGELLFRLNGYAFLNTIKISEGHYRLYVIDPGWLDPEERDVEIQIQTDGISRVMDILENKTLEISGNRITLTIPAGSLKIIDAFRD